MLSECFCVVDSREKNTKRIESVKEFMESHGGAVEFGALPLCDYKIEGIFREKEICIGIEAKSLTDFSGSYQELPDKLARSFELYNDVALFIEIPQIRTTSADGFHASIVNPSVPDGSADVLQYAVLQNSLESWQRDGVHVRQLQSESLWGYAIASVLINITKDTHRGLEITKVKDYKSQYLNILTKFDGIGQKTALNKILPNFPNLYWLCTYSEDDLKDALGKVTGTKLYQFIHNNDLITSEWANNGSKTQISKETEKSLKSNPEQSSEVKNPELTYLDENKPKFIEVPKGCYVNGGEIRDINPERDQDIETLQLSNDGQPYAQSAGSENQARKHPSDNPASQTLVGAGSKSLDDSKGKADKPKAEQESTNQNNGSLVMETAPQLGKREPMDKPHCSRSAISNDKLPEAPDNSEFTANPRMKDIVEFIRKHPRKLDDVSREFGLSNEYTFRALNELWHKKRIWFNKATLCFEFGIDKNPAPVVADKEYEVM